MNKKLIIFSCLIATVIVVHYVILILIPIMVSPDTINLNFYFLTLFIVIGSVSAVSIPTTYMIIRKEKQNERLAKSIEIKRKAIQKRQVLAESKPIKEEPKVKKEIETQEEKLPNIENVIFSILTSDELRKLNMIYLPKEEKKQFLDEIINFDSEERKTLIDEMLKNTKNLLEGTIEDITSELLEGPNEVNLCLVSLIEAGEKKKRLIVEENALIKDLKELIGDLYDYGLKDFCLSFGGIIIKEDLKLQDYKITQDDEIVIIPSRKTN